MGGNGITQPPPAQLGIQMGFPFRLKVSPITFMPLADIHMPALTQKVLLIRRLFALKAVFEGVESSVCVCVSVCARICLSVRL